VITTSDASCACLGPAQRTQPLLDHREASREGTERAWMVALCLSMTVTCAASISAMRRSCVPALSVRVSCRAKLTCQVIFRRSTRLPRRVAVQRFPWY